MREQITLECFVDDYLSRQSEIDATLGQHGLVLDAVSVADPWNGWAVPVVTHAELTRFWAACDANDHGNGSWSDIAFIEGDGALVMVDSANDERHYFTVCGMDDGRPVYAFDAGYTFVTLAPMD